MSTTIEPGSMEPIARLTRDVRKAAADLTDTEARFLVDLYYQIQKNRIVANNQVSSMTKDAEPVFLLTWTLATMETIEKEIKYWLGKYSQSQELGRWAEGICGIGPVLSAGLLAHIDLEQAPTVGHIWSFAGLNPDQKWEKGKKRPFNADLKTLCWKIGESFVKVTGNDKDIYGKHYLDRKALEIERNEAGKFAAQAEAVLGKKKIGKATEAYKAYSAGKLPPAHIHARAERWAVKLFLAHWWETGYVLKFGKEPPLPYPIAHIPGHTHKITSQVGRESHNTRAQPWDLRDPTEASDSSHQM